MGSKYLVMVSWYDSYCDVWMVVAGTEKEAIEKVKKMAVAVDEDYGGASWEVTMLPDEEGKLEWKSAREVGA